MYRDCLSFTFTNDVLRIASWYDRCECGAGKDMTSAVAYFKYYRSTTEAGNCTSFRIILSKAVPRLRPGFDPRPIHVGFVVKKVALGQVFLQVLRFPSSVPLTLIHFVNDATKSQRNLITFKIQSGPATSPRPNTNKRCLPVSEPTLGNVSRQRRYAALCKCLLNLQCVTDIHEAETVSTVTNKNT
jgi:hypothetical protein